MAKGFKFPAPKGYAKGGMCSPKGAKAYAKGGPARGTNMEASDMYDPSDLRTLEAGQNVPMPNKNRMRSESVQNAKAKADLKREYDDMYSFNPARMLKSDVAGAYNKMRRTEDQTGEYAKGGKVKRMAEGGKMRSEKTEQAKADRYALDKIDESLKASAANKKYADYRRDEAMEDAARTGRETGYGIGQGLKAMKKGGKAVMSGKMKMGRKFAKMADGGEVETEQSMSKATRVKMPKGASAKARAPRAKGVPVAPRAPMIPPQAPAPMSGGMSPLARVAQARAPMPGGMGMKMGGKAKKH